MCNAAAERGLMQREMHGEQTEKKSEALIVTMSMSIESRHATMSAVDNGAKAFHYLLETSFI